jgi:cytoskeletal protein RodZ
MSKESKLFLEIGNWMRETRMESGITLGEAAFILRWSRKKLEAFETGNEISAHELKKFANVFLLEREELLDTIIESYLDRFPEE